MVKSAGMVMVYFGAVDLVNLATMKKVLRFWAEGKRAYFRR